MDHETVLERQKATLHLSRANIFRQLEYLAEENGCEKKTFGRRNGKKLKTDIIQRHSKSSADFRIVQQTLKSNNDNAVFVYPIFSPLV